MGEVAAEKQRVVLSLVTGKLELATCLAVPSIAVALKGELVQSVS